MTRPTAEPTFEMEEVKPGKWACENESHPVVYSRRPPICYRCQADYETACENGSVAVTAPRTRGWRGGLSPLLVVLVIVGWTLAKWLWASSVGVFP